MNITTKAILNAVYHISQPNDYRPTVGEVAKIAGVSYGVADRHLQKLCKTFHVKCLTPSHGRVRYRFQISAKGISAIVGKQVYQ